MSDHRSYSNGYRSLYYTIQLKESQSRSNGYRSFYYGREPTQSTLTPSDVKQIRKYADVLTRKELAEFYDVSVPTIREVIEHLRWTNIN